MNRRYLTAVTPLPDHVLQIDFVSGSRLLLDMKPYLDKIRFRPLADARVWNSAVTNGIFVRFGDVELMAQRLSNREIAEKLYLSEGSVKQYVNQIYSKLHIEGDTRTKRKQLAELLR